MESTLPRPRSLKSRLKQGAHDAFFRQVHGSSLVYNTCWEDPRLDREMLELDASSRVVMITSAGCNALDYLLDDPSRIHAVDMNPRQNALLQLKIALLQQGTHDDLCSVFGKGVRPDFGSLLETLRPALHPFAYRYWKEKQHYFSSSALNPSFYYRGTSGQIAWLIVSSLVKTNPRIGDFVRSLLDAPSLEAQRLLYKQIEPALWNSFNSWLVRQPVTMTMLGVPRPQIRLIEAQFPEGLGGYIRSKVEHVLTRLPIRENYFWRAYATGSYTPDCCPNYLKPENADVLRLRSPRISTHTSTLANFLREHPATYSHYVLLDHQDWLAAHDTPALHEEWRLILQNSRPGTRILMRSAGVHIDFIPAEFRARLRLLPEIAARLHPLDRVGTYGCTLLAEIQ